MGTPGADLSAAASATKIHSATEFDVAGIPHKVPAPQVEGEATLIPELRDALYLFYCRHQASSLPVTTSRLATRRFIARLSEANRGFGTWDPGWQLTEFDENRRFKVTKEGLAVWVTPDTILSEIGEPRVGSRVRIHVPKEMKGLFPGFYLAIGDAAQPCPPPKIVTRVYWHLTADSAVHAVELVTQTLNERRVPFRFKVISDPQAFMRADAGVLYLDRAVFLGACDVLFTLHQTIAPLLRAEVPRFVKQLGWGLGVAEDPRSGESFGLHRCRLVAEGLWAAWCEGRHHVDERVSAVRLSFSNAGLDPDRPYLAPGSSDPYSVLSSVP